jgi:capsular polysaccharide biosynthesis protein
MKPENVKPLAGLLLLLAVGAGIAGLILWRDRAPQFQSAAAVRVVRDQTDLEQLGDRAPAGLDQTIFLQNQIETIRSDAVLQKVIDRLDLNSEWGTRFAAGQPLNSVETMELLRARTKISADPGTSLLRLQLSSHDQTEAAKLADAFAAAYCEYRMERRRRIAQEAIDALAATYQENEAKVQQASELVEKARREVESAGLQQAPALQAYPGDGGRDAFVELTRLTMIYMAQSNQLALSRSSPAEDLQKLETQVERTRTALTNAEAVVRIEVRKKEAARSYQNARQELEAANLVFAPIKERVTEQQRDITSAENPPAVIAETASPAIALPAHKATAAQACLVVAGVLSVVGVGLFFRPRKSAPGEKPAA